MQKNDIAAIGGGAGGPVVASEAAQRDLKVALIEKGQQLGGDVLHFGDVPGKTLVSWHNRWLP